MSEGTLIALVRHGQTDWNAIGRFQGSSDIELNEVGRGQAREAAARLRATLGEVDWDVVRYSPLVRAAETGQIIAAELGVAEARVLPALAERDWGAAEGLTLAECIERWPAMGEVDPLAAREFMPGVEPIELVVGRGRFALRSLAAQYPGGKVLVTSHGTLLRLTLTDVFGAEFGYVPNGGAVVLRVRFDGEELRAELLARSFDDEPDDPTQGGRRVNAG